MADVVSDGSLTLVPQAASTVVSPNAKADDTNRVRELAEAGAVMMRVDPSTSRDAHWRKHSAGFARRESLLKAQLTPFSL